MKRIFASVLCLLLVFALSSCGGTEQQTPSTPPEATQVPSQTKAEVFLYQIGEAGVPLINAAPVSMSCTVEDIYETEDFESFIWYQEWGKPAQELHAGDVVNIPAGVKHWHGAAKDSWFVHLAVEVPGEDASNEWLEPVTDEEYHKLP